MILRFILAATAAVTLIFFTACEKSVSSEEKPPGENAAAEEPQQEPIVKKALPATEKPAPEQPPHDPTAQVAVLGYHRFEPGEKDSLALSPENFRKQMRALKDAGVEVISMEDFLAWRRGEKNIPAKSAVITIDDGYDSILSEARPILDEFGYPYTLFLYTNWIDVGGKSLTWEEVKELRDAGVHIGSHSHTHPNLKKRGGKSETEYQTWLDEELVGSKERLEKELGIAVTTLSYPYGIYNEEIIEAAKKAGYEAMFTVNGRHVKFDTPAAEMGRFIVQSDKPATFANSLKYPAGSAIAASPAGEAALKPEDGATISDAQPLIEADLGAVENLDPDSVQMRISGIGKVPAKYNPQTGKVQYQLTRQLRPREYTVHLSAKAGEKKIEQRWSFTFERS